MPRPTFRKTASSFLALALLGVAVAPLARADVDIGVANGDKVTGTLLPATEVETFRVQLPASAQLSIVAKGKKSKGAATPAVSIRVLDATDTDIASGLVVPRGATGSKVSKLAIPTSGEYRVEVRGDGTNAGNYQVKIRWKSPTKVSQEVQLAGGEQTVDVAVDAGASANLVIKAQRGSAALPRLLRVERVGAGSVVDIPAPDATASAHKAKGIALVGGGDYRVVLGDVGGGGAAKITIKVKAPKAGKNSVSITGQQVGGGSGDDRVVGTVVGPIGGAVTLPPTEVSGLLGAALTVPAGAVKFPTALVIGSAPAIQPPEPALRGAGPTVFFGPEGQKFAVAVKVTIPFSAAAFAGDFSSLVVIERDARGKTRVVPGPYDVDEEAGTLSFPASHFTSYRAFGRLPPVVSDLNDDGIPDLVFLYAVNAVGAQNRVRVLLGGAGLVSRPIDASDIEFRGTTDNDFFGQALATGDVNGDGVDDLLIGAQEFGLTQGRVFIFFGGAGFKGSLDPDTEADVVLRGEGGLIRLGTDIAIGQFVGDATLDVVVGTNTNSLVGPPEVRVYEGGAALVSNALPAIRITGPQSASFATQVEVADVSGDGAADIVVSASFAGAEQQGAVFVFFGGPGLASGAHTDADVTLTGLDDFQRLGSRIAVGDVRGDAAAEIAASTSRFGTFAEDVFVFTGGASLISTTSAAAGVRIAGDGETTSDQFGTVVAIGNVGGDARSDLIIGDRFLPFGGGNPGGVAIYFGGAGFGSGGLADADALIVGASRNLFFGSEARVQDLTGDGVGDLIATDPLFDRFETLVGALHVFAGGATFPTTADGANITLTGLNFTE